MTDIVVVRAGQNIPVRVGGGGGPRGDPGANVMAIGLFSQANTLSIPTGTNIVRTAGYSTDGVGVADYVADVAVDAAYVAANPRTSFISANGRGFRLVVDGRVDIKALGAKGDSSEDGVGGTDGAQAVQAAASQVIAQGGGTLSVTTGDFRSASPINMDGSSCLRIHGTAGHGTGYTPPASQLLYSGTGAASFLSARNSNAFSMVELGVRYSSGSFTGALVDVSNLTGGADGAYASIRRTTLAGVAGESAGVRSARALLSFEGVILSSVVDSKFQWAEVGIAGRRNMGGSNVLYSNANSYLLSTFDNLSVAALTNFGEGCSAAFNYFEGTSGGPNPTWGMPYAYKDTLPATGGPLSRGTSWIANWHGDAVNVSDCWWKNGTTGLQGTLFAGGYWDTVYSGCPQIKLTAQAKGTAVIGTYMAPGSVDLCNVVHYGFFAAGNYFASDLLNLHNDSADIFVVANATFGGYAKNYIRLHKVQEFSIGPTSGGRGPGIFQFLAPASTEAIHWLQADDGYFCGMRLFSSNGLRWAVGGNSETEFATAGGRNFNITAYANNGGFIGHALTINRSSMDATFGGNVDLASGKVYKVNGTQVVGAQGAAVADAAALTSADGTAITGGEPPTEAEHNALIAEFNKLRTDLAATRTTLNTALARLRAATGHGLIA